MTGIAVPYHTVPGRTAPADLAPADVAVGALRWLSDYREWFDPEQWQRFLPRRRFPAGPLLELVVLLRCLRRGPFAGRARALAEEGLAMAERVCASEEFQAGLLRADTLLPYHAYLACVLHKSGFPAGRALGNLRSIVDRDIGDVCAADRPVLSRMELRYALDIAGIAAPGLPPLPALYPSSIVGCRDTALFFSDDEVYALTHVVFYLTDFGARSSGLAPGEQQRVAELVLTLLVACLARDDFDLAGELLLCAEVLGAGGHRLVEHGWQRLAGTCRADGAVPSPLHDPGILSAVGGEKQRAYVFGTCFHTTMVAAMAASERCRRAGH
ncbi:MAG TPA: hypothetical protein VHH34_19340 [Pseudonocardiaceae bacterium]|nr:hypothetical protein [Pseudonocardiaceae bacterium]